MADTTIINRFGTITGWNRTTMNVFGRDIEGITEISYDDKVDKANEYGAGRYPQGQSEKNYEAKAYFSVFSEEAVAIQKSIPKGMRIQDIPPSDVIIEYDYNGQYIMDAWRNFSFISNGREIKQGDGLIVVKFEVLISHVDWMINK